MQVTEFVVEGTLNADGTLELDHQPSLAPGRVTVVLRRQPEAAATAEDWWQFLQRARRELEAAGHPFMNDEELRAHLEWLRDGDPIDALLQQTQARNHGKEPR